MAQYALEDVAPLVADSAKIADSASLIGRVSIAADVVIGPSAVLRGDREMIEIGERTSIGESVVLHCDPSYPLTISHDVRVEALCVLHGCAIGNGTTIGTQTVILNGARIGNGCTVAAGSVITENKEFADGSVIAGAPAKLIQKEDVDATLAHARDKAAKLADIRRSAARNRQ